MPMRNTRKMVEYAAISFIIGVSALMGSGTFAGCGGTGETGSGGGGGASSASSSSTTAKSSSSSKSSAAPATGASSSSGMGNCLDDNDCDYNNEDCTCTDCKTTAFCIQDQCITNGMCTLDDAC